MNNILAEQDYKNLEVNYLVRSETYEILSISLEADCILPDHISPRDCSLLVLEGEIILYMDEKEYQIYRHQVLNIKADVTHRVRALANSKFLIIR